MKPRYASGFTSAQLLSVLPSVVVLILLLLPVLRSAKEKAAATRCLSNMRNVTMAMFMYANDYDGRFPSAGKCGRNLENDWTWGGNVVSIPQTDPAKCERVRVEEGVLWPYVTGMARVTPSGDAKALRDDWYASPDTNPYLCPTAGPVGRKRGLSYSMNCRLDVPLPGGFVGIQLSRIKNPSRTILLLDESDLTLNDGYFDPSGMENQSPQFHLKHRRGGNIAFCDGHVAWIEKETFLKVMDPDSDSFVSSR